MAALPVKGSLLVVEAASGGSQGVARALQACGFLVSGVATTRAAALELACRLSPDLVVIEASAGRHADDLATVRAMRRCADVPILYVITRADGHAARDAMEAEGVACLLALGEVASFATAVAVAMAVRMPGRAKHDDTGGVLSRYLPVSPREREVVDSLLRYGRIPIVAELLGISVHTARNHVKAVLRKLNLHSQDELFRLMRLHQGTAATHH